MSKIRKFDLGKMILVAIIATVALVYCTMFFAGQISDKRAMARYSKIQYESLYSYSQNVEQLENEVKLSNLKCADVAKALPISLGEEQVLFDVYSAKMAVNGFNDRSVITKFEGGIRSEGNVLSRDIVITWQDNVDASMNFILELQKLARTYEFKTIRTSKTNNSFSWKALITAYGQIVGLDNEKIANKYGFSWKIFNSIGKEGLFAAPKDVDLAKVNMSLFDNVLPKSQARDFVINICTGSDVLPEVAFRKYKSYNSTLGGANEAMKLNLVQIGEKYYYSLGFGDKTYPPEDASEIVPFNDEFVIEVRDDTLVGALANVSRVNLKVVNKTDKNVNFIGQLNKRLVIAQE